MRARRESSVVRSTALIRALVLIAVAFDCSILAANAQAQPAPSWGHEIKFSKHPDTNNVLQYFPAEFALLPPFDPAKAASDPENAIVADRQRGYTPTFLNDDVFDFRKPLYPPDDKASSTQPVDYTNLPPFRGDKESFASQFVLARAFREDAAFDDGINKPDHCLECFGDVFPQGYKWFYHGNADVAPITNLLDSVNVQWVMQIGGKAKAYWHRTRPIASGDDRIQYLDLHEIKLIAKTKYDIHTTFSFPSGHSTTGMIDALVLADIAPPEYRATLLARGIAFGDDRVILGVHYPTDVEAGRALAIQIHSILASLPEYKGALKAANKALTDELAKFPVQQPESPSGP